MIKHLIEFDGKQIALDRHEIVQLHSSIEPHVVGILNAIPDDDLPKFVNQYKRDIVKKRKAVKERKNLTVKESKENKVYENNVFDLSSIREEKNKRKSNG